MSIAYKHDFEFDGKFQKLQKMTHYICFMSSDSPAVKHAPNIGMLWTPLV